MNLAQWLAAERKQRAANGLTRTLRERPATDSLIDLAGNDYLGLARHPDVVAQAAAALVDWGAGATSSRLVHGTTKLHSELEQALADYCHQPSALVFSSGYLANLAAVTALGGPDVLIVSDAHVHASLIDACRLARSQVEVVPHHDLDAVAAALAVRTQPRALVLCEAIYSVLGDAAPLTDLAVITARHEATLIVDEAHALGALGPGLVAGSGLSHRPDVVVTGTLSKAFGSSGGVVLGSTAIREHLINTARPFIFDTGLAPASVAAATAAITLATPDRTARLRAVSRRLAHDLGVPPPIGAVLTRPLPSPQAAVVAAQQCLDAGIKVGCFRPPSVPDGISRLRITARSNLTDTELDQVGPVLRQAAC